MNIFECSQSSNEEGVQPTICNASLSQQILHNQPQFSSSYSLSQKNEAFNASQNKVFSQQYLPHVDNTLKLEDLNGKSSVKNNNSSNFGQQQQAYQQQQSQQTLKSFNSSNIYYHQSTITTTANAGLMPSSSEVVQIGGGESSHHINQNHLTSSSQYNVCTESNKDSQNSIHLIHNIEKQYNGVFTSCQNNQNQYSQNMIGQVFEQQKQFQSTDANEIDDQVRFYSVQQDDEGNNLSKYTNSKQIKDDLNVVYSHNKSQCQQNFQTQTESSNNNIMQKSECDRTVNYLGSQSQNLILNQQISNNSNQQNRKGSYCGSVLSGTVGYLNSDEKIQLKIVNEILNFDDQKLNCTAGSNFNATGQQQQFMNTNHVDLGSRIGNSTIKNLFNSTKDFQDISNLMANIEYTEQNMKMLDELSLLNKAIKEIEEKIELYSNQQKYFTNSHSLHQNQNSTYNTLTVKDRLKSIEEFRSKNLEPNHLKEMLNGRQQHLKTLNKDLIKLESEREKQKQMEGEVIKQVDRDFQKDVELMNQGLREISNLKQEVLRDMQTEDDQSHNERKSLGKEELIAKLMQRAELVAQMEDFEEIQEDFKQKFPLEAKYLLQQFQMKKDLDNIQNRQLDLINHRKEQASLSEQMQAQIQELNDYVSQKCNSIQEVQNNKQQQLRIYSDKMEVIEEQINKKCQSFGIESAESMFLQLFDERHITLSKQALEKQIELVEIEETNLNDQYIEQMENLEQRAQLSQFCSSESASLSSQQSPQSSPSHHQHSSRSHLSQSMRQVNGVAGSPSNLSNSASKQTLSVHQYLQDENTQQFNCASEQQKIKETFLIRSTMLRKWKEKAREHLALLDLQKRAIEESEQLEQKSVNSIINRQTIQSLIQCYFDSTNVQFEQTEIAFLTDLYEQYFETFLQQKTLVVETNSEEKEHATQLEEVEKKINELKEAKDLIRGEVSRIDEEISKIANTLKIKEQEINSKTIIMENILLQQADKAFQDYIEQQSEVFEGLQKTYGNKALQQIKLGHHKQFREIMKQNQEKRMEKFDEVQTGIEKINKFIQENIKYVDSQLSDDLSNIQIEIEESRQRYAQLEIDYETILQKEKEFVRQLDSLIQAKKVKVGELIEVGSRYMSYSTYEKRKIKLQKDIEDCESEIKIIEQNLKDSLRQNIYSLPTHLDCTNENMQKLEMYHSKQDSPQKTDKNIITYEENVQLNEMKKELDELQMQRLALESRLIEINFNINTSNTYDIDKQKQLLPTYISNLNIMSNNDQLKEISRRPQDIPLPLPSSQIEKGNKKYFKEKSIPKREYPNSSFFSDNDEPNSRAGAFPDNVNSNFNGNSDNIMPQTDSMSAFFSNSKRDSLAKFDKGFEEEKQLLLNQKGKLQQIEMDSLSTKNTNQVNLKENLPHQQNLDYNQKSQNLSDCDTQKYKFVQSKISGPVHKNQTKQNKLTPVSQQQLIGEQLKKQVASSSSSFFESQSQEQFALKSLNANSNNSQHQQDHQKQSLQSSINGSSQNQNTISNSGKNPLIQTKSSSSLFTMLETEEDPVILNNNCENKNISKQRNILNQQHQIAIFNQSNINIQLNDHQEGFKAQKQQCQLQQPRVFREITQDDLANEYDHEFYENEAILHQQDNENTVFMQSSGDNLIRKDCLNNNGIQTVNNHQPQQYEELGHTLQTITEEQISTNRGYSARNHMQQYLNSHQIPQVLNDQLKFQTNFIQHQPQIDQTKTLNHMLNGSRKLQADNFSKVFDSSSPQYKNIANQHITVDQKNLSLRSNSQIVEESMSQRERLYARKQKLAQQSLMSNQQQQQHQNQQFNHTQQLDQYSHQHSQHNRCRSLIQNPQESSQLLHENFKIKDGMGKQGNSNKNGPINQKFIQQQQFYNTKKSNPGIQYYPNQLQHQEVFNMQQNTFNNLSEEFYNNPMNQQENVCPNTSQVLPPQPPTSVQCKTKLQQKNIQPLLNNTYHSSSIQQNQMLSNESGNWFFTPNSNVQISFNSYLNSSLNKSKQMSKKSKIRGVDTQKCPNSFMPESKQIQPQSSKEQHSSKQYNHQSQPANNNFFDSSYSQSQVFDQSQRFSVQQQQEQQNIQFFNNHHPASNFNSFQAQIDPQFSNYDLENNKAEAIANHKKNRRSKSEEMKNVCISMQGNIKTNIIGGIKGPLIAVNQNKIRSKSQSVQGHSEQISKHLQQHLLMQQQQIQSYPKHFIYKLHLESLQNKEAQFLIQIKELLEGSVILKKFSQYQSLKQHVFNPFTSDQMPPENCGFGVRLMNLHKNLTKIEIRHPLKQGTIESTINIDQILRHSIPTTTAELIKMQKQNEPRQQKDQTKQAIQPNKNIPLNLDMVDQIQYYAFCVVLDKGGRIEFIAQDYKTFYMWTNGISQLVKLKKLLPRLKNYIEQIQII